MAPPVTKPQQYVRSLIGHRMQREKQILKLVDEQPRDDSRHRRQRLSGPRPAAGDGGGRLGVRAPAGPSERRGLVEQKGETMDRRLNKPLVLAMVASRWCSA